MEDINEIVTKLNVIIDQLQLITNDHEARLRRMEHMFSYGAGIGFIILLIVNIFSQNGHLLK